MGRGSYFSAWTSLPGQSLRVGLHTLQGLPSPQVVIHLCSCEHFLADGIEVFEI